MTSTTTSTVSPSTSLRFLPFDASSMRGHRVSVAAIEMIIEPRTASVGSGSVRRILPFRTRRMIGPFIFADLIGPEALAPGSGIDVDAHPHIGLSTLTYLFEGRMVHRDSTGAVAAIEPGAVNWMTAGRGVTHTERSHPDDRPLTTSLHGLQTWVALPNDSEDADASFEHTAGDLIPESDGVRLIAGSGWSTESPVAVSSPLVLAELRPTTDRPIAIDATHPERGVLVIDGTLRVGGTPLQSGQLAVLAAGDTPVLEGDGTAIVLGGEPVGERFIWWNFVHSDRDRIEHAKTEWTAQRFPTVPGDHDPWVPLPT
jgi:redox-sensitive bicupin YhaK (pirin superfamily)